MSHLGTIAQYWCALIIVVYVIWKVVTYRHNPSPTSDDSTTLLEAETELIVTAIRDTMDYRCKTWDEVMECLDSIRIQKGDTNKGPYTNSELAAFIAVYGSYTTRTDLSVALMELHAGESSQSTEST